jgi:hypothetical protein
MIVPTMINYEMLQDMLNSIDTDIDELIIIDNGGKLKNIKCDLANKISIINLPRNIGVAASWNLGIKLTPFAKWWFIASDDILFNPDSLHQIAKSKFDSFLFDRKKDRKFSAFAVHENIINQIGLFNEYFYPGIGEEIDYIEKLYKNNIKIYQLSNFFKDVNGGGNTIKHFKMGKHSTGRRLELTQESLKFDNTNKKNNWDLEYRRFVQNILDN